VSKHHFLSFDALFTKFVIEMFQVFGYYSRKFLLLTWAAQWKEYHFLTTVKQYKKF